MKFLTKKNLRKVTITLTLFICFISLFIEGSRETFSLSNNQEVPYITGTKSGSGYVALTCNVDLGWESEYIEKILDVTKEKDVKMSFNVTGKWAEKNKDLLLKIKNEGHEIGNHGYRHVDYEILSYEETLQEISTSKKVIEDIIKVETKFFQAPSGSFGDETVRAANELGYISFKWNIDTIDWNNRKEPDVVFERVKKKDMPENSIILMHPTFASSECISDIIDLVRQNNFEAGSLKDIF